MSAMLFSSDCNRVVWSSRPVSDAAAIFQRRLGDAVEIARPHIAEREPRITQPTAQGGDAHPQCGRDLGLIVAPSGQFAFDPSDQVGAGRRDRPEPVEHVRDAAIDRPRAEDRALCRGDAHRCQGGVIIEPEQTGRGADRCAQEGEMAAARARPPRADRPERDRFPGRCQRQQQDMNIDEQAFEREQHEGIAGVERIGEIGVVDRIADQSAAPLHLIVAMAVDDVVAVGQYLHHLGHGRAAAQPRLDQFRRADHQWAQRDVAALVAALQRHLLAYPEIVRQAQRGIVRPIEQVRWQPGSPQHMAGNQARCPHHAQQRSDGADRHQRRVRRGKGEGAVHACESVPCGGRNQVVDLA